MGPVEDEWQRLAFRQIRSSHHKDHRWLQRDLISCAASSARNRGAARVGKVVQGPSESELLLRYPKFGRSMLDSQKLVCLFMIFVQMKCCGATGPADYLSSFWFNQTQDVDGIFVPSSCCRLSNTDPSQPVFSDENLCQVEAILRGETRQPITQVHDQVSSIDDQMNHFDSLVTKSRRFIGDQMNHFYSSVIEWITLIHLRTNYSPGFIGDRMNHMDSLMIE